MTAERTYTGVGKRWTDRDLAQIERVIDGLSWTVVADAPGETLSLPMCAGEAIKATLRELRLPKVSALAWDGALEFPPATGDGDGEYPGLYGIEANYANGRARLYVVDDGCEILPVVADFWPKEVAVA